MWTSLRPTTRRSARRLLAGALAALTWLGTSSVRADESSIEELSLEEMLGVVEGVTRFEEPVARAPAAVTIISADEIARSGIRDLVELLRYVAGVQVVMHTPDSYSVAVRGVDDLAGNSIVLLIDGHHFTNVFDGETDWTALPVAVDDIERIEVVRGPVSVMYGANAAAGVVNVVRKGADAAEGELARAVTGVPFTYEATARVVRRFGDVVAKISARHVGLPADGSTADVAARRTAADAAAWWNLGRQRHLDVGVGGSLVVGDRLSPLFPTPTRLTTANLLQSASYRHTGVLGAGDELSVRQSVHRRSVDPESAADPSALLQRVRYQKIDVEATYRGELADWFDAGVSGSFRHVAVDSEAIAGKSASLPFYAAGLTAGVSPGERLDVRVGARLDYNEFVIRPKPSFRVAATLALSQQHLVRVHLATAFRHPTFAEAIGVFQDPESEFLYLVGAGTRALRPPEVKSAAIGYRGRIADGLSADVTVFAARSTGNITQEHRSVPSTFVNGETETQGGLETELRYTRGGAHGSAGWFAVHRFETPSSDVPLTQGAYLSLGSALPGGFSLDARASYSSRVRYEALVGVPASLLQTDIEPVLLVGARAAFKVPRTAVTIGLQVDGAPLMSARESPYPMSGDHGTHGYATVQYDH
jgi:outer membrane receptor protein involved in Fe transport